MLKSPTEEKIGTALSVKWAGKKKNSGGQWENRGASKVQCLLALFFSVPSAI